VSVDYCTKEVGKESKKFHDIAGFGKKPPFYMAVGFCKFLAEWQERVRICIHVFPSHYKIIQYTIDTVSHAKYILYVVVAFGVPN
jgi:hypothetical protein